VLIQSSASDLLKYHQILLNNFFKGIFDEVGWTDNPNLPKSNLKLNITEPKIEVNRLLAHSSTLKMKVTHSSKPSVNFHWTTQHYIPEDETLQSLL
jgi:hypothetical protein